MTIKAYVIRNNDTEYQQKLEREISNKNGG